MCQEDAGEEDLLMLHGLWFVALFLSFSLFRSSFSLLSRTSLSAPLQSLFQEEFFPLQESCEFFGHMSGGGDAVPTSCVSCGKAEDGEVKLKACTACRFVKYCGRDCHAQRLQRSSNNVV